MPIAPGITAHCNCNDILFI